MASLKSFTSRSSEGQKSNSRILELAPGIRDHHKHYLTKGYELVFTGIKKLIDGKSILSDINGSAEPGELLFIMGPSGAGKSTLLNAIAGRLSIDEGNITLNSQPLNKTMRRKISYVLQTDTFLSELTFWETIWYTAMLRLPGSMPEKEKKRRVYEIIDALDMRKCVDTIMGSDSKRGLSGGEKKRANIACELLMNPALMLLDEPTSGLDSATAYYLMKTLKAFAVKSGKTVVVTIHQPSSQIFSMCDRLLLLVDGKVAYFGPGVSVADHFASVDMACPPNYNIADHILDLMKESDEETKDRIIQRAIEQRDEPHYPEKLKCRIGNKHELKAIEYTRENEVEIELEETNHNETTENGQTKIGITNPAFDVESGDTDEVTHRKSKGDISDDHFVKYSKEYMAKWPTSFWLQFSVLFRRSFKQAYPRILSKMNITQNIIISVFSGLLWFQTKPEESYLDDRLGAMFFPIIYNCFSAVINGGSSIPLERPILNKERLSGYYRLSSYYLAKTAAELPLSMILPTVFFSIVYWLSGISLNFWVFLQMWLIVMLGVTVGHGIGFLFGALILDFSLAFVTSVTTMLACMLAGGFYVKNIPFWAVWMRWISFIQYLYYSAVTVDFLYNDIKCAPTGSAFCYNMTMPANITGSSDPRLPVIPKQLLLNRFTSAENGLELWHLIMVLVGTSLLLRICTYIILRYIRKPKTV